MKKKKKKLRGMTLVEIVISLLVFALLGVVLVGVGNAIDAHQRAARKTTDKVAVEGPVAEAQNKNDALLLNDDYTIEVKAEGAASGVEVKGKLYSVERYTVDENGSTVPDPNNDPDNLKFIDIQKPVGAITPATT